MNTIIYFPHDLRLASADKPVHAITVNDIMHFDMSKHQNASLVLYHDGVNTKILKSRGQIYN